MGRFSRSKATRLADAIKFLDEYQQRIGLDQNTIHNIKLRGEQEDWGNLLGLDQRHDRGMEVNLRRGRFFVSSQKTVDREALRALLLIYLYVGVQPGLIQQIYGKAALWRNVVGPLADIYIDQMRWLLDNYALNDDQRCLRAGAAARAAADGEANLVPKPWLYGEPLNKCPGVCSSAAFYFSFLGGVFSHMWVQQDMNDSCLTTDDEIRKTLGLPTQVPLDSNDNLASHPERILPAGTLVMMWTAAGVKAYHMVISVGATPDGQETQYVSVHTSFKNTARDPVAALGQQNFTYAQEDANRCTGLAWLMSHSSLIFLGDFNNDQNPDRFVTIAAAENPKWLTQPAYLR